MSLWRRERLRAWVSPARVVLAPVSARGRRTAAHPVCNVQIDQTDDHSGLATLLGVFQDRLAQARSQSCVDISLSDHFVRYVVLAWRTGLKDADWLAFAQHEFDRVYGRAAGERVLRIAPARRGAARVAAAVDAGLVEALRGAVHAGKGQVGAIEPNLCRVANRYAERMRGDGHLMVSEQGRLTRLTSIRGAWCDVQSVRRTENVGEAVSRMLAELRCGPGDMPTETSVWFWGCADGFDARSSPGTGAITVLPMPPSLPDGCAAAGMI